MINDELSIMALLMEHKRTVWGSVNWTIDGQEVSSETLRKLYNKGLIEQFMDKKTHMFERRLAPHLRKRK